MTGPTDPVDAPALPGDAHRSQLPERAITYWRILSALGALVIIIIASTITMAIPGLPGAARGLIIAVVAAALLAELVIVPPRRRRIWWYSIAEDQIDLEHGWLVIVRTVVPMTRVQHVEVKRGPLADRFDLVELEIHTAAGSVKIPALDRGEGDRIRQQIAELARISDDL